MENKESARNVQYQLVSSAGLEGSVHDVVEAHNFRVIKKALFVAYNEGHSDALNKQSDLKKSENVNVFLAFQRANEALNGLTAEERGRVLSALNIVYDHRPPPEPETA